MIFDFHLVVEVSEFVGNAYWMTLQIFEIYTMENM